MTVKKLYRNVLDIHETTDEDLKNVQALWANGEVMYFVGFPNGLHKTISQLQEWIKKLPERHAKHYSIYEKDLGYCGETFYEITNDTAIMDIKLLPKAQGRGIGQEALQFAIEQAFHEGAKQAVVNPFEINKKSIHLYKKLGFKKVRRVRQIPSDLVLPCEYTIDMVLENS